MAETQLPPGVDWEKITPTFKDRVKDPKKPERPSDGAIAMAQRSYDGYTDPESGNVLHAMAHRFRTEAEAELAAGELKRAGAYTTPESTVTVHVDEGDKRIVSWKTGAKRGRH